MLDSGASRSACLFGYAPDVSAKGAATTMFSIDGSPIEQRGYKTVHWAKRDSAGETKRGSTIVESSVFFRLPPDSTADASIIAISKEFHT